MKIQCDVCSKEDAAVFCSADEAALCHGCDRRVHHANKLASKHPRFSLLHPYPSPSSFPLCDICQEKRAILFCQQDRAILCRECDVPIHTANDLTGKHHRFLLTGIKLSSTPSVYSGDLVPDFSSSSPAAAANIKPRQPPQTTANNSNSNNNWQQTIVPDNNCSTISEYLMEMLPGWHVEDLLEATTTPSSTPFGFSKVDGGLFSFGETDSNISNNTVPSSASERSDIWVPEAPPPANFLHPQLLGFNSNKDKVGANGNYSFRANRRWTTEDLFAVPQISPPSGVGSKRSRPF